MSVGNPKKFILDKNIAKEKEKINSDITRVHKDKQYKVKKELTFSTKRNKSKLA